MQRSPRSLEGLHRAEALDRVSIFCNLDSRVGASSFKYEPLDVEKRRHPFWRSPVPLVRQHWRLVCTLLASLCVLSFCIVQSTVDLRNGLNDQVDVNAVNGDDSTHASHMKAFASKLSVLHEPPVRRAADGVLATSLRMAPFHFQSGPITFWTRAYEQSVPGPTLSVHPGDTIRLTLVNELEPEVEGNWTLNTYQRPNTTNLHVHGMHVDPSGVADNVFRTCTPGETMYVEIHIPKNHPRGLFMYHPHHHGSVMLQMGGGMVGGIIVEDDPASTSQEYEQMPRHLLIFQELAFTGGMASNLIQAAAASRSQLRMDPTYSSAHVQLDFDTRRIFPAHHKAQKPAPIVQDTTVRQVMAEYGQLPPGKFYTVNGQFLPKIVVQPRANHLLRLLNAGGTNMFQLAIPGCTMVQVAADGVYFKDPRLIDPALVLSPGGRADIVIQCTEGGPQLRPVVSSRHAAYSSALGKKAEVYEAVLAFIEVQGKPADDAIVSTCPQPPPDLYAQDDLRALSPQEMSQIVPFSFEFSMGSKHRKDGFVYKEYLINHRAFNPLEFIPIRLHQVQEWVIINRQDESGATTLKNHPFHLHTNSFQVIWKSHGGDVDYQEGDWRDVITVPTPGNVTIRFRPVDFTGAIVAHCHILGHSDAGMITRVDIVSDALN